MPLPRRNQFGNRRKHRRASSAPNAVRENEASTVMLVYYTDTMLYRRDNCVRTPRVIAGGGQRPLPLARNLPMRQRPFRRCRAHDGSPNPMQVRARRERPPCLPQHPSHPAQSRRIPPQILFACPRHPHGERRNRNTGTKKGAMWGPLPDYVRWNGRAYMPMPPIPGMPPIPPIPPMPPIPCMPPPPGGIGGGASGISAMPASVMIRSPAMDAAS